MASFSNTSLCSEQWDKWKRSNINSKCEICMQNCRLGRRWKVFDFEHRKCFPCILEVLLDKRFLVCHEKMGDIRLWKHDFVLQYLPPLPVHSSANMSLFLDKATAAELCHSRSHKNQLCTQQNWALPTKSRLIKCKPTTEFSKGYLLKLEGLFPMPVFPTG